MKIIATTLTAVLLTLGSAGVATAQNSSVQGYNGDAGQVQDSTNQGGKTPTGTAPQAKDSGGSNTTPSVSTKKASSLPFTGLDVALLAGAGGLLLIAGAGMHRIVRPRPTA